MPFPRPTLSALQTRVATDITTGLKPGVAPLLRFNNLGILGKVLARLADGLYGYLGNVALQATPFSATDLAYITAWSALKGVTQKGAVAASGVAPVTGPNVPVIPAGTAMTRADGAVFITSADTAPVAGVANCPVTAVLAGSAGNTVAGVALTLQSPIAGANSLVTLTSPLQGGLDQESLNAFRVRGLARYAAPAQGGSRDDYPAWAEALPQVSRAWVRPGQLGTGAVYVYVMLDLANAASGGFPVGSNGVSAGDPRSPAATGDQLAVANALLPQQPAEALVFVCSPTPTPVNFTISGMPATLRPLVGPAIQALMTAEATPGGVYLPDGSMSGVLPLARVGQAIRAATGTAAFTIAPAADIVTNVGQLATLGALDFQ